MSFLFNRTTHHSPSYNQSIIVQTLIEYDYKFPFNSTTHRSQSYNQSIIVQTLIEYDYKFQFNRTTHHRPSYNQSIIVRLWLNSYYNYPITSPAVIVHHKIILSQSAFDLSELFHHPLKLHPLRSEIHQQPYIHLVCFKIIYSLGKMNVIQLNQCF